MEGSRSLRGVPQSGTTKQSLESSKNNLISLKQKAALSQEQL
jgi:hypothetical protein